MFRLLAPALVVLVACGGRVSPPDSGLNEELVDAGSTDAGLPRLGNHARVRGTCGLVAAQLTSAEPSYVEVNLDFANDGFDDPGERARLTAGARQILMEGTAGGSSGISEAFAYEVLELCEGASFVKSETTIVYDPPSSKKTDILVNIAGQKVGVSVTRAVAFPPDAGYPVTPQRVEFLEGKLDDILVSSANVVPADRWVKQLLLVMAYDQAHAQTLRTIWNGVDAMTRANTVLYVVVTDGDDRVVYFNP
ncbi:MAG: hypothetical protein JNG84_14280 [Archangium sp.]|nr:hypothetical protein [Archangium sp.]